MPWTDPADPVSGTGITRAWAVTNVTALLRWLRGLTGGADPPGADYIIRSTSATATAWSKTTVDIFGPTTVPEAALVQLPIRAVNPLVSLLASAASGSGMFDAGAATDSPSGSGDWHVIQSQNRTGAAYRWQLAISLTDPNEIYVRGIVASADTPWRKLWHAGNDGPSSGLDADLLDGNSSAFYATASSVAAINQVPSGMIAAFATAAAIPAGWTRYSAADGRLLVGAGSTFSQTFTENTAVGANWTPFAGAAVISSTAADVTGATSGGSAFSAPSHQHTVTMAAQTWTPVARVVVWGQKS